MGVNGVPVAPHGLILGENEATPSKKLLKHLPDLKTAIKKQHFCPSPSIKQDQQSTISNNQQSNVVLMGWPKIS